VNGTQTHPRFQVSRLRRVPTTLGMGENLKRMIEKNPNEQYG